MAYAGKKKKKVRNSLHVSHRERRVSLASGRLQGTSSSATQIHNWRKYDIALLPFYVPEECLPCGKADRMIKTS